MWNAVMLLETVCSTSLRCRLCSTKGRMHSTALSVQTKCGCKYAKCMTLWCEVVGTKLVVAEGTFFLGKRILSQKDGQKQDQQMLPRSSKIFQAFNVMHVVHQHLKISRSQDPNSTRLYSRGFSSLSMSKQLYQLIRSGSSMWKTANGKPRIWHAKTLRKKMK